MSTALFRVSGIAVESVVDGSGLRCTIFFQGCTHACPGCHNPETWARDGGQLVTLSELLPRLKLNPLIDGVTFSGGEPFLQAPAAACLGQYLKSLGLNLWVYTGYTWETLLQNLNLPGYKELLNLTDILVDGPFQSEAKVAGLTFRGSANQRIIKVPESLKSNEVVLWQPTQVVIG